MPAESPGAGHADQASQPSSTASTADGSSEAARPPSATEAFSARVLILFGASVATTGITVLIGFLLARVLGPSGKGDYYLVTQLPVTIMVLLQLGLPQAFGYFAARDRTIGINRMTIVLTVALCVPALIAVVLLLPALQSTILRNLDASLILLGVAVLPVMLNATFTTGVLLARRTVMPYAAISIGQELVAIVLFIVVVGVLGSGLVGALWTTFVVALIAPIGYFLVAVRVCRRIKTPGRLTYRELLGFGLPLYPGSITQYFNLRADVYLLAWLLADPSAPLGYYSLAVTMAQLLWFLPNAVSQIFFPHVAGSSREDSDRQVGVVSRVTLLITAAGAIVLVPIATILINVLLPAFSNSLPAFYLLLPGVVGLSLTKVLSSYVAGVGRTTAISVINVATLGLNVTANLVLIPSFGILGAAGASLISYSFSAVCFSILAGRIAKTSTSTFWAPRRSDVTFAVSTGIGIGRRMLRRTA